MRLTAENLTLARGGRALFSGIGFRLEGGEALEVSGPNGAGKSTLLRVIAGLLPGGEGRLAIAASAFGTVADAAHYIGHRNAMKGELTVFENLAFWCRFLDSREADADRLANRICGALAAVGLEGCESLPFAVLSAGQGRRVALARLMAARRPLWLLDEPGAGLDRRAGELFEDLVRAHRAGGGIVIAATHGPPWLEDARRLRLEPGAPAAFVGRNAR